MLKDVLATMTQPKIMPVMVSFFTHGWTQQCVKCFQDWFPELKILVIDNNPTSLDQMENWNWCQNPNKRWKCLFKFCLAEKDWLKEQSNVILLQPDRKIINTQITHGLCIDLALNWCKENNIDIMLCVEPDNFFNGVEWFYDQLEPLLGNDRWWMTAKHMTHRLGHAVEPCPIMVRVDKVEWSFDHKNFDKQYYDFAQMVWHKCNERGRAKLVNVDQKPKGFQHRWCGSYINLTRNGRHCPLFTFL